MQNVNSTVPVRIAVYLAYLNIQNGVLRSACTCRSCALCRRTALTCGAGTGSANRRMPLAVAEPQAAAMDAYRDLAHRVAEALGYRMNRREAVRGHA